ncbi:MAG: nicotinamide mononucleotide transporter [Clostridia bacterium]|nr:nicotinamide mononucleotide transporter [Clostridia bacterium]
MSKAFFKKNLPSFILIGCTAILITVTGIYFRQSFFRILPLYISLIVAFLQSRVNRYGSLLGSANSLIYAAVYVYYSLYASVLSALLVSFPIQLLTFIRWNRNKWEQSTVLRRMKPKYMALLLLGFSILLVAMWFILPHLGAQYVFLDSTVTILGTLTSFLTMFAFVEYTFFMVVNCFLNIALYVQMVPDSPDTITYLVFAVYSFICAVIGAVSATKIYKSQQKELSENS